MKREEYTATRATLSDGERTITTDAFSGPIELAHVLSRLPRGFLDGVLRVGPRPGLNRPAVLDMVRKVVRDRIAAAATSFHARRAVNQAGRLHYDPKRWLKIADLQ